MYLVHVENYATCVLDEVLKKYSLRLPEDKSVSNTCKRRNIKKERNNNTFQEH